MECRCSRRHLLLPHIPVLLRSDPVCRRCRPSEGIWLDGTFGAGGYTRGLAWMPGPRSVIAVDRDPLAFEMAAALGRRLWRSASSCRRVSSRRMDEYAH